MGITITKKKDIHLYDVDIPLMSVLNHESTFISVDVYTCSTPIKQGTWRVAAATATCGPEGHEHVVEGPAIPLKECKSFDDAIVSSFRLLAAMFESGKRNAATDELIQKLQENIQEMEEMMEE